MKSSILTFSLSLILATSLAHGATRVVTDSNAQTEINSANNGDIIRFMPGTYPKITVVEKDLVFKHHGSVKANVFEIEANGSKLDLIDFSAAKVFANKSQNRNSRLRVVRGRYGRITSDADNTILAYSTLNYLKLTDSGTITGNDFDGDTQFFSQVSVGGGIGIDVNATSANVMINNNHIHDYKLNHIQHNNIYNQCIGIRIAGSPKVNILNNFIQNCFDDHHYGGEFSVGMGVYVLNSLDVRILGNIIQECFVDRGTGNNIGHAPIFAPLGVHVQNNLFHKLHSQSTTSVKGGVVRTGSLFGDPKLNSNNTLKPDSPCIDKGPPDPQYNDRDGSRNDIGMFGGHNFIPDGRTTDKPIVLGLDVAPIAVPTGGTVTIESTGATVK
jgi:nitrous oxidase accessory protein NosD